ncbi:STM4015 family protein [Streptomyces sp. UH6]|uniref:STM4015 family protein n=1 Tax=Streptomyces sp. UH6 TaxID=2748379 RepID=UPI0015D5056E|nr:STM4015 family protein [Streptomyces sp. UH6]NYV75500.1 STM4015 family protein [Streptomyces sp. UH6]
MSPVVDPRSGHLSRFHGMPVFTLPAPGQGDGPFPAASTVAWRVAGEAWDGAFTPVWRRFLDEVAVEEVTALVIGAWWDDDHTTGIAPTVGRLIEERHRFPALRALQLADVVGEESEISWIRLCDLTPLLHAFPRLEKLGVRGGDDLDLEPLRHEALRELRIESGNLPRRPVQGLGGCELPALEHLDIWLGAEEYGADTTVEDLLPLLHPGGRLPALRHLGLANSEIQDGIAAAVAGAPVVPQLESLDLSMGTLGDEGGSALLAGQPLTHLRTLDLRHHYFSDPMAARMRLALEPYGVRLLMSRVPVFTGHSRYVAVSE